MKDLTKEFILSGTLKAQENTWNNRYNSVVPSIKKEGASIKFSIADCLVYIDSFDEIILTIIMKFLFAPVWLVKQFYESGHLADINSTENKINSWVKIGLIWKESSVTGQYIRPTYLLFKLFGETPFPYSNIPFNMLTHTICEEKVMFDVMSGISDIVKKETTLPRVSELGFDPELSGANVIAEEDFRNPKLFKDSGIAELSETENKINLGMKEGSAVTPELTDFRQFVLVKKVNNTGTIKNDYKFHVPDLIIPVLRDNGKPKSIAIEVELTNKRSSGYEESLSRYKDNNKYGSVYWLCADASIAEAIKTAYKNVGGTGSCKTALSEFIIPFPEF